MQQELNLIPKEPNYANPYKFDQVKWLVNLNVK